jgi:hypothetical protein
MLLWAYLVTAHIFTFYFWYIWAKEHDFLSAMFLGPIVAEFKGLFFPFFI